MAGPRCRAVPRLAEKGLSWLLLFAISLTMILPFAWTLSASLQYDREIFQFPFRWIPETLRFGNYQEVWTKIPFLEFYLNTFKLSAIITVGQLITSSFAAYAFARLRFPGRNWMFLVYIATMMVPWQAIMIPQFTIVKSLGLYNTHAALVLLRLFSPFGVFLLRQTMQEIPAELSEAGRMEGCNELYICTRIVVPNSKAGLATLAIFTFSATWNDYLAPMIYIDAERLKTIQLGLAAFRSMYGMEYGLIMAGTVSSLIPMVLIYCFAQKYMIQSVAFSGMKA